MKTAKTTYQQLLSRISSAIETGKEHALSVLNQQMLQTYWEVGHYIIVYEQHGNQRAEYGSTLLKNLSKDLTMTFGKGFSRSNIQMMRQFFLLYPDFSKPNDKKQKSQTSGKLTWSHYCELISISDDKARSFYEKQSVKENWSVRELKRQVNTALFERLALSKDKKAVMQLAKKGHEIAAPSDIIKDPYFFEFLNIPQHHRLTEKGLEKKLIDNLQHFLLDLGKGFSLVARQYKITIDNQHYFIDLVFYHRILKCFVFIDLKINKVKHQDIGQMNLYLNYFKGEENVTGDHEPIGIIICADKNDLLVKYATGGISNRIFVSKYKLYLPDSKLLEQKVKEIISGK